MKNQEIMKTWKAALFASMFIGVTTSSWAQDADTGVIPTPPTEFSEALAAYDAAWSKAGLSFAIVTFTEGGSAGFGKYTERAGNSFSEGEEIAVYAEPVGFGFESSSNGYSYQLDASYRLLNLSGQVLAEQQEFASFSGSGRTKQRELSAALTFQFGGLPAGDYILEASFADAVSNRNATLSLPFSVAAAD